MNQRSRNRRRHTTVLVGQLVERRNGRRVAQHHGDLTATGNAFRLAFGPSLGVGHGSVRSHLAHVFNAFTMRLPAGQLLGHRLAALFRGGCNCEQALFNSDPDKLAGLFTKIGSKGAAFSENLIHGLLQSGVIPPMDESYSVTSNSQHLSIVRRNSAGSAA